MCVHGSTCRGTPNNTIATLYQKTVAQSINKNGRRLLLACKNQHTTVT
jgi:hypothetical protein